MRGTAGACVAIAALLALPSALPAQSNPNAAASRSISPYPWPMLGPGSEFSPPLYLVRCLQACPSDGLMLVPDPSLYPHGSVQSVGGPYADRPSVEFDRDRLVAAGLPDYTLRIHIFDWAGDEIGAFWLGTYPSCGIPELNDGPLSGDVMAEFGPAPISRPPAMPLPVDIDRLAQELNELEPRCEELYRRFQPSMQPGDPNRPVTAENPYV